MPRVCGGAACVDRLYAVLAGWPQVPWRGGRPAGPSEPAFSQPRLAWPLGGGLLCPAAGWAKVLSATRCRPHQDPENLHWKHVHVPESRSVVCQCRRRLGWGLWSPAGQGPHCSTT